MKIVILTSERPHNIWLVNQLLARQDVAGMVIERRPLAVKAEDKVERRRRMIKKYGLLRTINKLLFNKLRSRFLAGPTAETVKASFFPGGAPLAYTREVPTIVVPSVNDATCIAFIKQMAPELLAVCGTGVLKPEVFTLAPQGTINIHTGITPEYRSADPIFWALYMGEPDKVGVTVHYIDRGIDTGPIIHQEAVPVYADDTLATIYVRCIRKGAQLYKRALADIQNGSVRTIDRSGVTGRSFFSIDMGLVQYLLFRWRFYRLAARLPRQDSAAAIAATEANR
jgi:methionyl-tRNA formyltransferase